MQHNTKQKTDGIMVISSGSQKADYGQLEDGRDLRRHRLLRRVQLTH